MNKGIFYDGCICMYFERIVQYEEERIMDRGFKQNILKQRERLKLSQKEIDERVRNSPFGKIAPSE